MESDINSTNEGQKWITLKSFRFEAEAAVLAARLEMAEIPVYISNSIIASTIPMAGDHVHLQVPAPAIDHAKAILYDFNEDLKHNEETNFREASKDDIAFQKALNESNKSKSIHWVLAFVIALLIILLLWASGFNRDSFRIY